MKRTDLPIRLRELLKRIPYITIATVNADGQPWNSPVVGTFDENLNVYWVSWKENQHSQNVAQNPHVFIVVYDSQIPLGQGEGLYLKMLAKALETPEEMNEAQRIFKPNFFKHSFSHTCFLGECPRRIYKATPEAIWYNTDGDEQGHFVDKREALFTRARG